MTDVDYCVVGAGFAGLTAALRLKQAGRSVALLEARDRVGGRTFTVTRPDGTWIDRGGAWIGPGQDRIYAMMDEFGVPEYKAHRGRTHLRRLKSTEPWVERFERWRFDGRCAESAFAPKAFGGAKPGSR